MFDSQFLPFQPIQFMDGLLAPPIGASGVLPTYAYVTTLHSNANASIYTFSSAAIGTAATGRLVVVAIHGQGSGDTINSVTVAGVSATLMSPSATSRAALFGAVVDAGTTGDIVVTWNTGQLRTSIGVWALYDLSSTTPIDTAGSDNGSGTSNTSTDIVLDMTANSIGVFAGYRSASTAINTTNATERYDATMESVARKAGADYQATTAETRTVNMDAVAATAGAVWR